MRRVWERALRGNDEGYLARKARERREAELRLQRSFGALQARGKRVSWERGGEEAERVHWEVGVITREWKDLWE